MEVGGVEDRGVWVEETGPQAGIEIKNAVIWFLPAKYFQTLYFRSKARVSNLNVSFAAK